MISLNTYGRRLFLLRCGTGIGEWQVEGRFYKGAILFPALISFDLWDGVGFGKAFRARKNKRTHPRTMANVSLVL